MFAARYSGIFSWRVPGLVSGPVFGLVFGLGLLVSMAATSQAQAHENHDHASTTAKAKRAALGSSAALDAQGKLWVVSVESSTSGVFLIVRNSGDLGQTWSKPQRITPAPEAIAAKEQDFPRIAFGKQQQALVIWTKNNTKHFSGDVRYSRSADGGASWSAPATLQQDRQPIAHRFGNLMADADGNFYVAWIDQRDTANAKAAGQAYRASSLYYSVSGDGGKTWRNDIKLADHTCECCRLAMAQDSDGLPLLFWRQAFEGERDHALIKLTPDGKPGAFTRSTQDAWKTESCPDQGPSLAVTTSARHAVWFAVVGNEGKVFYGRLANQANQANAAPEGQRALPDPRAEHASIVAKDKKVWIAWNSFDGKTNTIAAMRSDDGGNTWQKHATVASARGNVDQPRLLLQGDGALLVWHTEQGMIVKAMP